MTILLMAGAAGMEAQPFRFAHYYNVSNGLSSNTVQAIVQDNRGFMWFGTDNGLDRFDGYTFKTFRHIPGDSTTVGSNYIFSLYEDRARQLWVGTQSGVFRYLPEKEEFAPLDIQTEEGVRITSRITSIIEDKEGTIWFATLEQGVFACRPEQPLLRQYRHDAPDERHALTSDQIGYLYMEEDGTIWAASREKGVLLNRYDPEKEQFFPCMPGFGKEVCSSFSLYAITGTRGYVWFGSWLNGLFRLDKKTGELKNYLAPGTKDGAFHIHSLLPYGDNLLLVGSDDGLHCFDMRTETCTLITATKLQDYSLSDKFIYPIYRDREGGLWIGTYYGGINYSPPGKGDIEGYMHLDHVNSVAGDIISCFCEDRDGNIWIGTDDGGLSHFNSRTKTFVNYFSGRGAKGLSYHNVHALLPENDKLWIGTYAGGLNVLDIRTMQFKWYLHDPDDLHSIDENGIYSIYRDSDGNLWIGSMQGLMSYNPLKDNFDRRKDIGSITYSILEDGQRNVWFATGGKGLFRYSLDKGEWSHFTYKGMDTASIPSNEARCLALDCNKRLWVGTDEGICKYNPEAQCFERIKLPLPSSVISSIVVEGDYLWLSTTNGLVRYVPGKGTYHVFTQTDGLQSDQFTGNAALLASSGKMYLGTVNGFTVLDPSTISMNCYVPPVYITNLQLFNKDEGISTGGVLSRSIEYTDEIILSHKQNMFSFEFTALSYSMPTKNRFKYFLEGFDKDWNEVNNQRKATYTNLPAGRYRFHVIASNDDQVWNEEGASVVVVVRPPFWRTVWAYLLYVLMAMGITGWLVYRNRCRMERRHQMKIQQLNAEKEREIHDARINFFTLVIHEIRTPLSLIIGPLERIVEGSALLPQPIRNNLKVIERNSNRLLSLVNQLLDFKKMEQGAFIIRFVRINIGELLLDISDRFKPMINQKGISFDLHTPKDPVIAGVDTEALTKIVSNLLTNAMKYAIKQITVSLSTGKGCFCISVKDDGCGIPEEEQSRIFAPFYQVAKENRLVGTGIGLSLVRSLVDAHRGMIEVDSRPGEGAAFRITLPLQQREETVDASSLSMQEKESANSGMTSLMEDKDSPPRPILLIVEDNSEMSNFLCEIFEQEYSILLAENGKKGLEMLCKNSVDLIISDMMMPVMDGIKFISEVKQNILCSHIPVILLSARTDDESKVRAIHAGADIYVEKPFSQPLLRAQIENLLSSRRTLRRKFSEMPFIPLDSIAGNKADEQFLSKMNAIIEANISNQSFNIDNLAEQLCVSRSGLFAKIKKQTDMTPNDLIQLLRLKKAAELLASGKYKIYEISLQVGFNNPSYFSRCFLKQFGVLPKDFS